MPYSRFAFVFLTTKLNLTEVSEVNVSWSFPINIIFISPTLPTVHLACILLDGFLLWTFPFQSKVT